MVLETINPNALDSTFRLGDLCERYAKAESRLDGRFIMTSLIGAAQAFLRGETQETHNPSARISSSRTTGINLRGAAARRSGSMAGRSQGLRMLIQETLHLDALEAQTNCENGLLDWRGMKRICGTRNFGKRARHYGWQTATHRA